LYRVIAGGGALSVRVHPLSDFQTVLFELPANRMNFSGVNVSFLHPAG